MGKIKSICGGQRIVLLDLVKDEIEKGEDELTDWIQEREFVVCNHVTASVVNKYQEILRYVESCGYYTERALNTWVQPDVARAFSVKTGNLYYMMRQLGIKI